MLDNLALGDHGTLSLLGLPTALLPPEALFAVQRELEAILGPRAAGGILFRAGVAAGLRGFAPLLGSIAGDGPTRGDLDAAVRLWGQLGLGKVHIARSDANGGLFEFHVERCLIADGFGAAPGPVCHLSAGWMSGILQAFSGREYRAEETRCAAAGAPFCVVVLRPAE